MADIEVTFLADSEVTEELDHKIRILLTTCFTGPQDDMFSHRRFWKEPPAYRWMIADPDGTPVAHLAVHDKVVGVNGIDLRVAGISEVAVHPTHRGTGLVKKLMAVAHPALEKMGMDVALLFGNAAVYRSSGYTTVPNPVRYFDDKEHVWKTKTFNRPESGLMYRPLATASWPSGTVDLRGPTF